MKELNNSDQYPLRSSFQITCFEEEKARTYWVTTTAKQRLAASWKLTCAEYNVPLDIKMDRSVFSIGKQDT